MSRVRSRRHWLDVKGSPYLFISPFFVLFAVFGVFPLAFTAYEIGRAHV